MKFKNWIVKTLGIFTTLLSVALIYLILFKDGKLRPLSANMLIEFCTVIMIAVSTKFFWYTSTESTIRTSQQYLDKRDIVSGAIEEHIQDAKEFDDFIEIENDNNYNKYVSNRCKNMTALNYKMSFFDWLHWLIKRETREFYMIRYMLKVERQANNQHKLSGHSIRSLTQSNYGLTDDRNFADIKKIRFLWTGAVFSFSVMFLTAAIAFEDKLDMDIEYAMLKMVMYVSQILFSILQSILKARMTVANEDMAYFNRILSILEKYIAYKKNPYTVERVSYIPKEVVDGTNNKSGKETIAIDSSVRSEEQCEL